MKIHETLFFLLIIGISSSTTAQSHISTENESVSTALAQLNRAIKIFLKDRCNRNGGPGAYESASKSLEFIPQCMKSVIDGGKFRKEWEIALRWNDVSTVIKKYCKKVPKVEKCLMNAKDMVAPCFDAEGNEDLQIIDRIADAVLEYICGYGGERIILASRASVDDACLKSHLGHVHVCLPHTFDQLFNDTIMNLGSQKCLHLEEFKSCVTGDFVKCSPQTADFFEGLFSAVRRVIPCEEPTSIVTPADEGATQKPTEGSENVGQEQKPVRSHVTLEELTRKTLVKQIEAAEAQVRAANAQERAAVAQEQAAMVDKTVVKSLWKKKCY